MKIDGRIYRPSNNIPTQVGGKSQMLFWDGFAREERLGMWKSRGASEVTIKADAFAERSDTSRELVWDENPVTIHGLVIQNTVRVITREASPAELSRFGHGRMPRTTASQP
jgi:hypothetical protein